MTIDAQYCWSRYSFNKIWLLNCAFYNSSRRR